MSFGSCWTCGPKTILNSKLRTRNSELDILVTEQAEIHSKNLDVKCLRCGAYNIAENHICGRCGASLPLVYDEDGRVFSLRQRAMERALIARKAPSKVSTVQWLVRFGVILFALYIAYMILHRHH